MHATCTPKLRIVPVALALVLAVLPSWADNPALSWQQNLTAARQARSQNDWEAANGYYELALRQAERFAAADQRLPRTLEELARAYAQQKDKDLALELQQRAVELRRAASDEPSIALSESIYWLGKLHEQFGAPELAEPLYRQALEMRDAVAGASPSSVSVVLRDLAEVIQELRPDDEEAEALWLRNVEIDDNTRNRMALARYYGSRDAHEQAVEQYLAALAVEDARGLPDLHQRVRLLTYLGREYRELGQPEQAESRLLEALELREEHLGERHPYIAFTLRELGELYAGTDRYAEAEQALLRARELNQAAWGTTSDRCSCNTQDLLARVQQALGHQPADREQVRRDDTAAEPAATVDPAAEEIARLDEQIDKLRRTAEMEQAERLAQRAVELRTQAYGDDSPELALGLDRLGQLLRDQRRYDDAIDVYEQELLVLERGADIDDPRIAATLHDLGELLKNTGRIDDAELYLLRENSLRDALGQNWRSARVLETLGNMHLGEDDPARAEYYLGLAFELWEEFAGESSPELARLGAAMARSQIAQQKYDEAEALLDGLLRREQDKRYADASAMIQLLQPLKSLYDATGRAEDAAAVEAQIAGLRDQRLPATPAPAARRNVAVKPAPQGQRTD